MNGILSDIFFLLDQPFGCLFLFSDYLILTLLILYLLVDCILTVVCKTDIINRPEVMLYSIRIGMAQWVARLNRNVKVVDSSPIKGPRCVIEQETLPLLLSTGWFQERIRTLYHNRTKIS